MYGLLSGRTRGHFVLPIPFKFPRCPRGQFLRICPCRLQLNNKYLVVYVARTGRHRPSALTWSPLLRSARPRMTQKSQRQSGESKPLLLSSSIVPVPSYGNPAPRAAASLEFFLPGFLIFILVSISWYTPTVASWTVNTSTLVPRCARPNAWR